MLLLLLLLLLRSSPECCGRRRTGRRAHGVKVKTLGKELLVMIGFRPSAVGLGGLETFPGLSGDPAAQ